MNPSQLSRTGKALVITGLGLFLLITSMSVAAADLAQLMELADKGDATAQDELGLMYTSGNDVPKNLRRAADLFRKSADQGLASAQFHMALSYQNGKGVKQNFTEAARWFQMAADQGHVLSQRSLGGLYSAGRGVQRDYATANQWFRKAADMKDIPAQYYLGVAYQKGQGVQQDQVAAANWYRNAAEGGYARAQYSLGFMYANGVGVQKDLNKSVMWISKAADQGLPIAQSAILQLNELIENVQQREAGNIPAESLATIVRKDSVRQIDQAPVGGQAGEKVDSPKTGSVVGLATSESDQDSPTFLKDKRVWIIFSGLLLLFGIVWMLRARK